MVEQSNTHSEPESALANPIDAEASSAQPVPKSKMEELSKLLARCFFKQGEWQVAMKDDWNSVSYQSNMRDQAPD